MSRTPPPNTPSYSTIPGQSYALPAPSTSASAVASLVFGVLGCIPFIPGFLAVVFGSMGLRATRSPQVGGRGLAIAGLVLGLVSICGWGGAGGILGLSYVKSKPGRIVARQFVSDLSTGNITAASAAAPTIAPGEIQVDSDALKTLGPLTDLTFRSFNYNSNFGGTVLTLGGVATFAKGTKWCLFTLTGNGSTFTIQSFTCQ